MNIKIRNIVIVLMSLLLLLLLGFPLVMWSGDKQGKVLLSERIELPFEVSSQTKVLMLYFGYVGCRTVCMPTLKEIAEVFDGLEADSRVGFYFINISKEGVGAREFAGFFHKDFVGLQLSVKDTSNLMGRLRAYSSEPLSEGGELYHTGYLYLIRQNKEKDFELKVMYYTRPFDRESILLDIKKELE